MISARKTVLVSTLLGLFIFWPLLTQAYWPARWPLDAVDHAIGRDFVNIWVGGRLLWEGHWQTLFDVHAYQDALRRLIDPAIAPHVWSYPPTSFLIAAPLAALPYGAALALWTLAGLASVLAVARIGLERDAARVACLALLLAPATLLNIICGQNGFFTAALLAGGVLLLDRRPIVAGILIGVLSYKPHFGIVIAPVLLALGAWRTLAAAAVTAAAMVFASMVLFGVEPWQAFVAQTMPNQAVILRAFEGFFTTMLISPYAGLRQLGVLHGPAMALQVGLTLAAVTAAALAVRRTRDPDTRLMLVASATFLATPYALTYDLPVIALVLARLLARNGNAGWSPLEVAVYAVAWALPLASPNLMRLDLPLAPLVFSGLFYIYIRDLLHIGGFLPRPAPDAAAQPSGGE